MLHKQLVMIAYLTVASLYRVVFSCIRWILVYFLLFCS